MKDCVSAQDRQEFQLTLEAEEARQWWWNMAAVLACLILVVLLGWVLWRRVIVPQCRRQNAPKFLGHFYVFPRQGVEKAVANSNGNGSGMNGGSNNNLPGSSGATRNVPQSPSMAPYPGAPFVGGNAFNGDSMNAQNTVQGDTVEDEVMLPPQPEPTFVHGVHMNGAPLVLDTTDMDLFDIARVLRQECVQQAPVFGLSGRGGRVRVYVPAPGDMQWDAYGEAPEVQPHTVAVFSLPAESWLCQYV